VGLNIFCGGDILTEKVTMVEIRMLAQTFYGDKDLPPKTFYKGEIYNVPEEVSARWIQHKIAEASVKAVPLKEEDETSLPDLGFSSVPGMKELLRKRKGR
jgi:hypothetical protein